MSWKKTDCAMPVLFILLSALLLLYCSTISKDDAAFLRIISLAILLSAGTEFFFTLRKKEATVQLDFHNVLKVLALSAILTGYVLLLKIAGFLPMTALLGIITIRCLGYRNWRNNMTVSGIVTLIAYAIFSLLLKVPLPMGALFS